MRKGKDCKNKKHYTKEGNIKKLIIMPMTTVMEIITRTLVKKFTKFV